MVTPPNAAKARSWQPIRVSTFMLLTNSTKLARPTAQGGAERLQWRAALAELDPVDLQLFAHCGLEPDHWVGDRRRPQAPHERAQLAYAVLVTPPQDLAV